MKGKLFIASFNNDPPFCALINCVLVVPHITHVPRFMFLPFLPTTYCALDVSVDKAVYHHDLCYLENDDTATRNAVCDKNMLKELEGIYNPTLLERLDKSIVSKLIGTKVKFGMGV